MRPIRLTIIEAANQCGMSVEHLVRHAGEGNIRVFAFASNWTIISTDGDHDRASLNGDVQLCADELKAHMNHVEYTISRVTQGDQVYELDPPQELMPAQLIVDPEALPAFRADLDTHRALQSLRSAGGSVPPYLDPGHAHFSLELSAGIQAWIAMYEAGGHQPDEGPTKQLKTWLMEHFPQISATMRGKIATVVNPKKRGGAPKKGQG